MNSILSTKELLEKHPRWEYVRTDRNGTRYFHDYTCSRCGGAGGADAWIYTGYTCYKCGGTGRQEKPEVIKVYTPEHEAKLEKDRAARRAKREAERVAVLIRDREKNLLDAGFGKEDNTYVIYRVVGETFSIKDQLKEEGCRFNRAVGWFSSIPLVGRECQRMEEKDILEDFPEIVWKKPDEVKPLWFENLHKEKDPSVFVGEVGDRLELYLHIDRKIEFDRYNQFSHREETGYIYIMRDNDKNVYKWSTSCFYKEDDDIHVRATVKDHIEYKGVAQTVLTRCTKVKK